MKLSKNVVFYASMILLCFSLAASAQIPSSSHVILVIEENTSFNTTVANMPWLVNQGNVNGFANNYTTNSGGSLLDYLWLSSGSCHSDPATTNCAPSTLPPNTNPFGCSGDSCDGIGVITDDSIFAELDSAQPAITWKVYAESLPSVGFLGFFSDDGNYVARHNPAVWYNIINSDAGNVVPFEDPDVGFAADLANGTLPTYSIIVPNLLHDAHDCPGHAASCTDAERVGPADDWLANNLENAPNSLLSQPFFQPGGDGLLIITFDNGDGDDPGQVYTAVIGPQVVPNTISNAAYMHQNTLRTICDALGIGVVPGTTGCPGAATDPTTGLIDFF